MFIDLSWREKICCIILVFTMSCLLVSCSKKSESAERMPDKSTDEPERCSNSKADITVSQNKTLLSAAAPKLDLVPYNGPIQHMFFHPLIIYPEKAFDGDSMSKGYNDWFVTVGEFKKILESVYSKGYMLVDINQTYEINEEHGQTVMKKKQLYLPKGKKPLIISIDDLNYYEYMIQNGNASRLILDDKGCVETYSVTPKGEKVYSYDNDIVPILDKFVEEHKDFSLNGAKGIIALTGYEGVLGYRTNKLTSSGFENEKSEALRVVKRLKETGWVFACHGYGHLDTAKISLKRLARDTELWKKEVESITGSTNIYIYPFGSSVNYKDPKFRHLLDEGFRLFFGVGSDGYTEYRKDCMYADRRSIDGLSFKYHKKKLMDLFDTDKIIDSIRPQQY